MITIMQALQIIVGLPLALFIPGYLMARIFFGTYTESAKAALGFVLSITFDIIIGLFLGYNAYMKKVTGGITVMNLWIYLSLATLMLVILWALKDDGEYRRFISFLGKLFEKEKEL